MASSDPPNTPSCPVDHCPIPVDIAIKSSDGRTFGAHAKNLEWFTEGFPLVDSVISTVQEPVELTEDGDVLALLLTFTHNLPAPDLTGRSIDAVMGLADAADKYGVHYALVACRKAMRSLSEDSECNALRIVKYKASHNDLEDIDYIAPRTMNFSIVHVLEFFGEDHAKPFWRWVRYQQSYMEALERYRKAVSGSPILHELSEAGSPVILGRGRGRGGIWIHSSQRKGVCPQFEDFSKLVLSALEEISSVGLPTPTTFRRTVKFVKSLPEVATPCLCGVDTWCENVAKILENPPRWLK